MIQYIHGEIPYYICMIRDTLETAITLDNSIKHRAHFIVLVTTIIIMILLLPEGSKRKQQEIRIQFLVITVCLPMPSRWRFVIALRRTTMMANTPFSTTLHQQ